MNILLLRPKYAASAYDAPLNLAILGSIARQLKYEVKIVDCNRDLAPTNEVWDIVGITGMSLWKQEIKALAATYPDSTVVVGGPWATLETAEALADDNIDYVVAGEGESAWKEFLYHYSYVSSEPRVLSSPVRDLNALPLPAWDLVPHLCSYAKITIWTSRGCPHHCCFCNVHKLFGRYWRGRSVDSVLNEIAELVKLGVKWITFADDNPTFDVERFKRICEGIIARNLKITLDTDAGTRVDRLPDDLLVLMKQAGFRRLQINPESGCQRVINEVIHKDLDLSQLARVAETCKRIGLGCDARFVIGFPWETKEEVQETLKVARDLRQIGVDTFVGNALPYPDTELYERAKAEGFLQFDGPELLEIINRFGERRTVHCLSSPYWSPEWIIKVHQKECRAKYRSAFRRTVFSTRLLHKLATNPAGCFDMLKRAI